MRSRASASLGFVAGGRAGGAWCGSNKTAARPRTLAGTLSRLGQFRLDLAPCTKLNLEGPRP